MKFPTLLLLLVTSLIFSQNIINLPVYANIPHIYDPPKVHQDKELKEFLRGEIHCQNFINQDLTVLQPSVIHVSQPKEDNILPERNTIAVPPIATQENNPPQEQHKFPTSFGSRSTL